MGVEAAIVGGALASSVIGGNAAKKAANTSANAQLQSAQLAADAARFRPVGVTTRFGQSTFGTDEEGNVTDAGYTVAPDIANLRDRLLASAGGFNYDVSGMTGSFAPAAQKLFGLGSQYLAQSPQDVENQYIARTTAALAPQRERDLANVRNRLVQTGRTGLATGGTTGMAASNPELQAYYNAIAQQDLNIAQTAQQQGQQQTQFGAGLFGTGANILGLTPALANQYLAPIQGYVGTGANLEQLGQSPLDLGAQLGGRAAQSGAVQANALLTGGIGAAQSQQAGQLAQLGMFGNTLSGLTSSLYRMQPTNPNAGLFGGYFNTNSTASPFFNTGADVFSSNYFGGTSAGE